MRIHICMLRRAGRCTVFSSNLQDSADDDDAFPVDRAKTYLRGFVPALGIREKIFFMYVCAVNVCDVELIARTFRRVSNA